MTIIAFPSCLFGGHAFYLKSASLTIYIDRDLLLVPLREYKLEGPSDGLWRLWDQRRLKCIAPSVESRRWTRTVLDGMVVRRRFRKLEFHSRRSRSASLCCFQSLLQL